MRAFRGFRFWWGAHMLAYLARRGRAADAEGEEPTGSQSAGYHAYRVALFLMAAPTVVDHDDPHCCAARVRGARQAS